METFLSLYQAFQSLDISILSDPDITWMLYTMLFAILFLENGLLPAAFLPGDTLLFLTGVLISQDVFHFGWINIILITGAVLGTWIGYIQGRWLGNTKLIRGWVSHLPEKYYKRTLDLLHKYGLQALFVSRFIPFVRTALPLMVGLSEIKNKTFHIYNLISATLWIFLITTLGYLLGLTPLFDTHRDLILHFLLLIPVFFIVIGVLGSLWVVIKRKLQNRKKESEINR